jgi:hypothetical protein
MSVTGRNSIFKNIEGLVVYVSPDTTDERINEFTKFILLQTEKEIILNNGININVPIVETTFSPIVNPPNRGSSNVQKTSKGEYEIDLDHNFCKNPISKMGTEYAIKEKPNYITLFALTPDGNKDEVVAFLITMSIKTDISGKTEDYSLWVDALCSDQVNEFKGGSNLLRLVLALCKKFNKNSSRTFTFVNLYLEALAGVESTYRKLGFNETYEIKPDYSDDTIFKKSISETKSNESPVTDEKSMASNFVNAELGNKKQEEKLVDGLDSGEITWVIDRTGDRSGDAAKGVKSRRRNMRKTIRKRNPKKSRRIKRRKTNRLKSFR